MCSNGSWIRHGNPGYSKPIVTCGKTPVLPHTEKECLAEGGVWKKMGIDPRPSCNRKAIDRGNLCRDSSECEGRCQVELTREEIGAGMRGTPLGKTRFGRCSVWVVELGCQGVMENGRVKVYCYD